MRTYRAFRAGALTCFAWMAVAAPGFAADESDLAGRAATWEEAFNSDDLEAIAALYAEDGCRMPPNAETVEGREAIVANLQAAKEAGAVQISISVTEAESVGDMAYGSGTYELTGADGSQVDQGKWLNVSKRTNGEWEIYCDIWNTNTPLPTQ